MSVTKSHSASGDILPAEPEAAPDVADPSGEIDSEKLPVDVPPVTLLAPGSHDDSFSTPYGKRLEVAEPDPLLGRFVTPDPVGSESFPVATDFAKSVSASAAASSASFPAINVEDPPAEVRPASARDAEDPLTDEWEEEVIEERRTPWSSVLLASYASAITLALGWTLMKDRSRGRSEDQAPPSAVVQPESARQAWRSRKIEPPEPILGEHFARLGQPLVVGSLEITPLGIRRENVILQHSNSFDRSETRDEGENALALKLKLRNRSADAVFAPLDQAYLRERGKDVVDTFIETADKERIYPYRLAVDSEWSVVGQDFTELRPGESRVVTIVSAPNPPPIDAGPFTWRVRLRTGIDRTDTIGIRWPDKTSNPK